MPAKKPVPLKVTLRFYEEEQERLAAIAKAMSGPGNPAGPTEAVRFLIDHGYPIAEKKLGITVPAKQASK